jgi:hypothetical protein
MAELPDRVRAPITRLNPRQDGTFIRLDVDESIRPKDGYFWLETSHPNYYSLYSLALTAAVNRSSILVRARAPWQPGIDSPAVSYLMVDW